MRLKITYKTTLFKALGGRITQTLNEANLTSVTQTLNFNPTMHYQVKTSQPG
jgi:hypothetical protein